MQPSQPYGKADPLCHLWIQGAERQTVSPITSRQSRNKRLRTRCLRPPPSFAATTGQSHIFQPLGPISAIHTTSQISILRHTRAPTTNLRKAPAFISCALISSSGVWGLRFSTTCNIKSANVIPCRLPIDERSKSSLRRPVKERRLHGL